MPSRVIKDYDGLVQVFKLLSKLKLPFTLSWVSGADRSGEQNRLMWKWAQEVADQRGDMTRTEVQHEWKLIYGVPILRGDDEEFRQAYDSSVKAQPYEKKLALMKYISITSEFSVAQMTLFLNTVQREMAQQGIRLTDPSS